MHLLLWLVLAVIPNQVWAAEGELVAPKEIQPEPRETRHWNIRSGFGGIIGLFNVEAAYRVAPSWTVGPTYERSRLGLVFVDEDSFTWGARGNYYFKHNPFLSGWYASLRAGRYSGQISSNLILGRSTNDMEGYTSSALMGYQWHWEHLSITLGLGAHYMDLQGTGYVTSHLFGDFKGPTTPVHYSGTTFEAESKLGASF